MVPPEPPPRPRAQPQPAWGVRRRRRSVQQGRPPGPMQRLPPPEGRGRRARGAAAASVAARIPAWAPVAAPARCPSRSAPAPSPRSGLPKRIRWIIRLAGPGGDGNFGEGGGGEGPGGSPRPAPARAPSPLSPGGGRAQATPRIAGCRLCAPARPPAGSRAPRPARGRHSALPAHPSLTPREGCGEGARRRSRGGATGRKVRLGEGAERPAFARSRGLLAKVRAAPRSVHRLRCWEKTWRPLGEPRRLL